MPSVRGLQMCKAQSSLPIQIRYYPLSFESACTAKSRQISKYRPDMYESKDCVLPDITLIGYPFGSTGRAEHVRAVWRALAAAGVDSRIYNVGGYSGSDERLEVEFL